MGAAVSTAAEAGPFGGGSATLLRLWTFDLNVVFCVFGGVAQAEGVQSPSPLSTYTGDERGLGELIRGEHH